MISLLCPTAGCGATRLAGEPVIGSSAEVERVVGRHAVGVEKVLAVVVARGRRDPHRLVQILVYPGAISHRQGLHLLQEVVRLLRQVGVNHHLRSYGFSIHR
jgi:hypothetical protein